MSQTHQHPPLARATQRIAIFTKDMRGGGAERVLANLAGAMARQGDLDVDLVVCRAVGPNLKLIASDVRIIDLDARQMSTSILGLVKYIRREKPVAILSALDHANVVALIARSVSNLPARMVISVHNSFSDSIRGRVPIKKRMELPFIRAFYPFADDIVAVSKGVADDLASVAGISRGRIKVIYNPVMTDQILERSLEPFEHPWFGPNQPPVILNVARLTFQKDQTMLLRAFAKLLKSAEARLIILGEGEARPALESLAAKLGLRLGINGNVLMPGFLDNPYAFMAHSSIFALSSRFEGLPTVLIEALTCGSSIVSTDCPSGPNEILAGGKWGLLTPVGDADAFAAAMLKALSTKQPSAADALATYDAAKSALAYRKLLLAD